MQTYKLLILALIILVLNACTHKKDDKYYIQYFSNHQIDFDELAGEIISKYDTDFNQDSARIILINDRKQTKTFDGQIIDDSFIPAMEELNIDEIRLEKGKYNCDTKRYFKEVSFRFFEKGTMQTVEFIKKPCNQDSIEYESSTILSTPINSNWKLFIDRN